jgi:SNF2 family DNA or RNA helicase
VLDEAQFIKNSQTKTSQAIRRIDADWRIGLSGTPLENHLGELWSLFRTISPGLLGSWERFRRRFADPIERHKDGDRRESLARLVRPFILRRTKDKVLRELPPRTEITLNAELSQAERRKYEEARLAALAELSGVSEGDQKAGQQRIRTLAWLTRLRQLACHPRLVDATWKKSSAKLDLLMSLVEELRQEEHRALVFSQFVKHLTVIREALDAQGVTYQYLDGTTPAKERQRRVDAFQAGEGELFLISLKAGGTGLNLTGADYVIHLDPWWNPAVEDQATDRAHRIGQQRPVTVYRLVAEDTIEEQILSLHADKRELVAGVLDGTDRAASMETADLIRLIKEGATS